MTIRPWWLWGLGIIGIAVVALLAVIAFALVSDDGGTSTELAQISKTATPGPSLAATATPQATPSPTPPAATPEPSPTPCPDCPEPTTCPACPTCPDPVTCPACICPTCPEPVVCPPSDCPTCRVCPPAPTCPKATPCPSCPIDECLSALALCVANNEMVGDISKCLLGCVMAGCVCGPGASPCMDMCIPEEWKP